jgi:hypothetical protein
MPQSPFQKEVAAANAAFGVPGVLSFFIRDNFLVATVIGASVMLFFMGIGHVVKGGSNFPTRGGINSPYWAE